MRGCTWQLAYYSMYCIEIEREKLWRDTEREGIARDDGAAKLPKAVTVNLNLIKFDPHQAGQSVAPVSLWRAVPFK